MIEIIANSNLDQVSYIDSNGNPIAIADQNLIKTCQKPYKIFKTF